MRTFSRPGVGTGAEELTDRSSSASRSGDGIGGRSRLVLLYQPTEIRVEPRGFPARGLLPARLFLTLARKLNHRLQPAFGARSAISGLVEAVLRYAGMHQLDIFAKPQNLAAVAAMAKRERTVTSPPRDITVRSYLDLPNYLGQTEIATWFNPGPEFWVASHARKLWSRTMFPITATHHTISYQALLHSLVLRLLMADSYPCDSMVCTSSAARTALSNLVSHVKEEFNGRFGTALDFQGRLDMIPLGIDTDLFVPRDKMETRRRFGLPGDACIVLYIGRLSLVEKADLLPVIRIFEDLVRNVRNQKLLLVLAGTQGTNLMKVLAERFLASPSLRAHVRVMLPRDDRHLLFPAADIFVSPSDSIQESFGLTVVEAMACGVPQLVPAWNGYAETVEHGKTGFLTPTWWTTCDTDLCDLSELFAGDFEFDHLSLAQSVAFDHGVFRQQVEALVANPELRREMSKRSRERAVALYSHRSMIAAYEALWAELVEAAAKLSLGERARKGYSRPVYHRAFGHYATQHVEDTAELAITPAGLRALQEEVPLFDDHPAVKFGIVDAGLLRKALARIGHGSAGSPRPRDGQCEDRQFPASRFLDIIDCLEGPGGHHPDYLRRQVMWLVKYGLVEVRRARAATGFGSGSADPTGRQSHERTVY
jgi:D-inositol-3-phosphate glycosyltransferase